MKKIFTLMAFAAFAVSASAVTPFKNLYVEAYVSPTGAGEVYINPKNDEDAGYVFDQSEDWGETAYLKYVGGENGNGDDVKGCNKPENPASPNGTFEVKMNAAANAGYELVCYADAVYEDGIYGESDVYPTFTGDTQNTRVWSFTWTGEAELINVNSLDAPQTGDSNNDDAAYPSRDECLADESLWNTEPDTKVYAIFREVGAELPKFDPEFEGHKTTGVLAPKAATASNGVVYNAAGQQVGKAAKGLLIQNGKKVVIK